MTHSQLLLNELKSEAAATRKILERVPIDKNDWTPHAKSMALGKLAMHVAEIPSWVAMTLLTDELDFAKFDYKLLPARSTEELLAKHDETVEQAIAVLETFEDKVYDAPWTMRTGEKIHYTMPKSAVVRRFAFSHLFHHRAQLGVYLRLLDIPIPGMYGPTADELEAMAKKK